MLMYVVSFAEARKLLIANGMDKSRAALLLLGTRLKLGAWAPP